MRGTYILLPLAMTLVNLAGTANAKGCLKGAAVGGVAGHLAGHHAIIGAAAGCAIEHHREKVKDKKSTPSTPTEAESSTTTPNTPVKGTSGK